MLLLLTRREVLLLLLAQREMLLLRREEALASAAPSKCGRKAARDLRLLRASHHITCRPDPPLPPSQEQRHVAHCHCAGR